ncbi:biliverdin-producing heme oxygenase [Sphingomonas nostoxanthinifaciens]|uniref:biliverdin-producing heme oxygenase n=1 Tax=Sphingomonas nostoxanthinifaciens TaxID=2872652 RepID=UPI001CC2153E|nr:biliverdin-producing heme oxygenase [Sphingomonas nostoxanthinifaciens]UAK26162.1 biliverdin-producing heme oxygenase [Sphingomonas nostoxanthinifaciens]
MTAHARLRAATADDHVRTDTAFGAFDLADAGSYAAFLRAHARALPPIEALLTPGEPGWTFRPRTPDLRADLAALDEAWPAPLSVAIPTEAAGRLGMLYVIEGSRLGGGMLAARVADGLPRAYLSAVHERGAWRAFCQALDAAYTGEAWFASLLAGARAAFSLYAAAARVEPAGA